MKILFGPYGSELWKAGIPSDALAIHRDQQQIAYYEAVKKVAKGYARAGATLPTVNAFFLRFLLRDGLPDFYKEMLSLNLEALLAAFPEGRPSRIAISLGPANDCYRPELAPNVEEAAHVARGQYEACLEVLQSFKLSLTDVVFLHETIGTGREAIGVAKAAQPLHLPLIVSFVVNRQGRLLSGATVEQVIQQVDQETERSVEGFSLNCCSPFAFGPATASFRNRELLNRLVGFYPNSYDEDPCMYERKCPLAKPKTIDSLTCIAEKGRRHGLQFIGGCCGFGTREIGTLVRLCKAQACEVGSQA